MTVSKNDVLLASSSSMIELSDEQVAEFTEDFNASINTIADMLKIDVSKLDSLIFLGAQETKLREDAIAPSKSDDLFFKNAPEKAEHYFIVPKIVE